MPTATKRVTAKQLAALPDHGKRYELIEGVLRTMTPAGYDHGRVAMRLGSLLEHHVREHRLGVVCAAETGFLLSADPDTVRAPDVAFISHQRLQQLEQLSGYLAMAPDLVAEVTSPSDSYTDVEKKAIAWLDAGTRAVLVVDPGTRTVRVYRSDDTTHIDALSGDQQIDVANVVPGWNVTVADIFA
jgi:Uma2 family endonuclease